MKKKWFESWFDTEYYHLLYKHRDDEEAQCFIKNIIQAHHISSSANVLDLACGKGRHAAVLSQYCGDVLGVDLSSNSILEAQKKYGSISNLKFGIHDMRNIVAVNYFDAVFNLFTSFGYFERHTDNDKVLRAVATALAEEGLLILDYINTEYAIKHLVPYDCKIIEGKLFTQNRYVSSGCIIKDITVEDGDILHSFRESVQLLDASYFREAIPKYGLNILAEYGDYSLGNFDVENSRRYIVVAKKNSGEQPR